MLSLAALEFDYSYAGPASTKPCFGLTYFLSRSRSLIMKVRNVSSAEGGFDRLVVPCNPNLFEIYSSKYAFPRTLDLPARVHTLHSVSAFNLKSYFKHYYLG